LRGALGLFSGKNRSGRRGEESDWQSEWFEWFRGWGPKGWEEGRLRKVWGFQCVSVCVLGLCMLAHNELSGRRVQFGKCSHWFGNWRR
jgi:hypothetical protein